MKLIIDIPEKVVTAIQNGEDYRYDIHTTIAQGIPYDERPQGDLISRDALTDIWVLYKQYQPRLATNVYEFGVALKDIIDNTPTIESDTELKGKIESYKNAYRIMSDAFESEVMKNKRAQYEWIETKHRVNLLIGVLYSNQAISKSDLEYIEDSIKKLMKGEKAVQND